MAVKTGTNGRVKVGGNTVAEITGFSIEESTNVIENNNLNSTASQSLAGRTSWTATVECRWDKADTTGQGAMTNGSSATYIFLAEGDTTGSQTLSGDAIINSVSLSIGDESVITKSFSLTGTGALTLGAVA